MTRARSSTILCCALLLALTVVVPAVAPAAELRGSEETTESTEYGDPPEEEQRLVSRCVHTYSPRDPGVFAQRLAVDDSGCTRHLQILMSTFQTGLICPFKPPGEVFQFGREGSGDGEEPAYTAAGETKAAALGPTQRIPFGCHEITAQVFVTCECANSCFEQDNWVCTCPDTEPGELPSGIEDGTGFPATVLKEAAGFLCDDPGPCELPICSCIPAPGQPRCAECIDPCTGRVAFTCPVDPV